MVRLLQGSNSLSDQLRSELAQSAAQRFLSRTQPQQPIPDVDYLGPAIPAVSGLLQSGVGALETYQKTQQRQESLQQQAQAVSQQYQIPYEQALQVVQSDPAIQKQLLGGLQKQQEQAFQGQRDVQKYGQRVELEGMKQAGKFDLEQAKHKFKLAQTDYKNATKDDPDKKSYDQILSATRGIMNVSSKAKYDPTGYFDSFGYKRDNEEAISNEMTKYIAAIAPKLNLNEADRKRLHEGMITQFYKDADSRQVLVNEMLSMGNPTTIDQTRQEVQRVIKESAEEESSTAQPDQFKVRPQESRGIGFGEDLAHRAAVLGSSAVSGVGGIPGMLQQRGMGAVGGAGQGLPLDYLSQLENMDPELIKQIEMQRAQETPQQTQAAQQESFPGQLPTPQSIKEGIGSVLPEGFLENRDVIDAGIESIGQDLPIYALAVASGGAGALVRPVMRSMLGGATVDAVKRMGGGPVTQMLAGVGTGMLVDKGFRTFDEGKLQARQTSDLKIDETKMYDAAATKGAQTKLITEPLKKRYMEVDKIISGPASELSKADKEGVKEILRNFEVMAKSNTVTLPELITGQKGVNAQIRTLDSNSAKHVAAKINKGINEMLELAPDAPGVKEYNIGKNIHQATSSLNKVEDFIYRFGELKVRAGASIAATYVASLLGVSKAPLLLGGPAAGLAGSSAYRQLRNLATLPQAQKAAWRAVKEIVSGNDAKGQRNLMLLAKLALSPKVKGNGE